MGTESDLNYVWSLPVPSLDAGASADDRFDESSTWDKE
jgi:hypothetical protein